MRMIIPLKSNRFVELENCKLTTYWPGIGEPGQDFDPEKLPEDVLEELFERELIRRVP